MWIERLNAQRHNVSSSISLAVVAVIWLMTQPLILPPGKGPQEPMEFSLSEPAITPNAQANIQPKQPSKQLAKPPEKSTLQSTLQPEVKPLTSSSSPSYASATAETAKTEFAKVVPPSTAPLLSAPQVAEPVKAPSAPPNAAIESSYVATLRAQLNANKRYPTGREASLQRPSGKTVVWFVLNRNGTLSDAGIEDSSNSIILDNAAMSTVRRTNYVTWPEGSWPSQAQHRFSVTLDFVPLN
jgi:protein TonB